MNPGQLVSLLPFGDKGDKGLGGRGGEIKQQQKKKHWANRGWQVVGSGPSGCYFLALVALAEFRGGVTGLPDPIPPPAP